MTPATDLGEDGVAAYAALQGVDVPTFLEGLGPTLTPEQVGEKLAVLAADGTLNDIAYLLTPAGLSPL